MKLIVMEKISALQVAFEGEIIHIQYCIENKRFDAYLPTCKRWIEVDEYDQEYRDAEYERNNQLMIESNEIAVIRTNPKAPSYKPITHAHY